MSNKLEYLNTLLFLTQTDWFGRPKLAALRGLKIPKPADFNTYILEGSHAATAKGIDVGGIESVLGYLCGFCGFMTTYVCPLVPKPSANS